MELENMPFMNSCPLYAGLDHMHKFDRIGGVMVSVFASSAVDREFEPRSAQTKDYKIGICCFFAKNAALRSKSKSKNGWLGSSIMCLSGATCQPADRCVSELAL
jgi:hypothetical protein